MFADLGTDELQRISSLCHTQQLGSAKCCSRRDPGDALYGVRRGQIRIETGASDGSRLTLNFMGSGDLFRRGRPCSTARAVPRMPPPVSRPIVRAAAEDFLGHLRTRSRRSRSKIIMLLCQRIRWQSERMEESMLQPLPVRLAGRLCAWARFRSECTSRRATRRLVGAARKVVNRQLQLCARTASSTCSAAGFCCRT